MSSFAVFTFSLMKSFIACRLIFVNFPLCGTSLFSSVSPLYSILVQLMFVLWFKSFVVLLLCLRFFMVFVLVASAFVVLLLRPSSSSIVLILSEGWVV